MLKIIEENMKRMIKLSTGSREATTSSNPEVKGLEFYFQKSHDIYVKKEDVIGCVQNINRYIITLSPFIEYEIDEESYNRLIFILRGEEK